MPKQITQAELRSVLETYTAARKASLQIRRRIVKEDATIEPGPLAASSVGQDDPIEDFSSDISAGLDLVGLEIHRLDRPLPPGPPHEAPVYSLSMIAGCGCCKGHSHELDRDEYLAGLALVTKMRGYAVSEVPNA